MTEKRKKVAVITGDPCPQCGYYYYIMKLDLSNPEADEIPLIAICIVCRRETRMDDPQHMVNYTVCDKDDKDEG